MNSNNDEKLNTGDEKEMDRKMEHEMHRFGKRHFWKFPVIFSAVILLKGVFVMALWNALIPDLFHGPVVNFWQALGLVVLAKLLVGFQGGMRGFGVHGHHRGGFWGRRWSNLSPEERQKLREHMHRRHHSRG
jgi:hypothetical protein